MTKNSDFSKYPTGWRGPTKNGHESREAGSHKFYPTATEGERDVDELGNTVVYAIREVTLEVCSLCGNIAEGVWDGYTGCCNEPCDGFITLRGPVAVITFD